MNELGFHGLHGRYNQRCLNQTSHCTCYPVTKCACLAFIILHTENSRLKCTEKPSRCQCRKARFAPKEPHGTESPAHLHQLRDVGKGGETYASLWRGADQEGRQTSIQTKHAPFLHGLNLKRGANRNLVNKSHTFTWRMRREREIEDETRRN
jgi:hypothetical protein